MSGYGPTCSGATKEPPAHCRAPSAPNPNSSSRRWPKGHQQVDDSTPTVPLICIDFVGQAVDIKTRSRNQFARCRFSLFGRWHSDRWFRLWTINSDISSASTVSVHEYSSSIAFALGPIRRVPPVMLARRINGERGSGAIIWTKCPFNLIPLGRAAELGPRQAPWPTEPQHLLTRLNQIDTRNPLSPSAAPEDHRPQSR